MEECSSSIFRVEYPVKREEPVVRLSRLVQWSVVRYKNEIDCRV